MAAQDRKAGVKGLAYICARDIQTTRINWLWENRIAKGKVTMFAGEGGKGKSTVLAYLTSLITRGASFPVDNSAMSRGKVVILSAEDGEGDTIKPRLCASNAELDKVFVLRGTEEYDSRGNVVYSPVTLDTDISRIDDVLTEIGGVVLLIIDPITAYLGKIKDHNNSEVRMLISRLTMIAEKHQLAIILNTHLSKAAEGSKRSAAARITGSIAYVNAARAVYLFAEDPDNPGEKRVIIPVKNNIGKDSDGYRYAVKQCTIDDGIVANYVEFDSELVTDRADDIVAGEGANSKAKKVEAEEFLIDILKYGSVSASEILKKGNEQGFSNATLYRVKKDLNIKDAQAVGGRHKIWFFGAD